MKLIFDCGGKKAARTTAVCLLSSKVENLTEIHGTLCYLYSNIKSPAHYLQMSRPFVVLHPLSENVLLLFNLNAAFD